MPSMNGIRYSVQVKLGLKLIDINLNNDCRQIILRRSWLWWTSNLYLPKEQEALSKGRASLNWSHGVVAPQEKDVFSSHQSHVRTEPLSEGPLDADSAFVAQDLQCRFMSQWGVRPICHKLTPRKSYTFWFHRMHGILLCLSSNRPLHMLQSWSHKVRCICFPPSRVNRVP